LFDIPARILSQVIVVFAFNDQGETESVELPARHCIRFYPRVY